MKVRILLISSIFCSTFFIKCSDKDEGPLLIDGPIGTSHFFINNKTEMDLKVVFTRSNFGEILVDSTNVSSKTSLKIFQMTAFGYNTPPTRSFSKIEFYNVENQMTPVLIISPIINDDWSIINQVFINGFNFGLIEYEFTILNEILIKIN